MGTLLCKLFRFFLNVFEQLVNVIADALVAVGTAAIDVLSDLAGAASDALGLPKLVVFIGLGAALWLLSKRKEDKKPIKDVTPTSGAQSNVSYSY